MQWPFFVRFFQHPTCSAFAADASDGVFPAASTEVKEWVAPGAKESKSKSKVKTGASEEASKEVMWKDLWRDCSVLGQRLVLRLLRLVRVSGGRINLFVRLKARCSRSNHCTIQGELTTM